MLVTIPLWFKTQAGKNDEYNIPSIEWVYDTHFPIGHVSLRNFIDSNLVYPQEAKEKGIQGKVILYFVVNKDGSISHINILHDIGGSCASEAVRLIKSMPKWIPAREAEYGQAYILPIDFTIKQQ